MHEVVWMVDVVSGEVRELFTLVQVLAQTHKIGDDDTGGRFRYFLERVAIAKATVPIRQRPIGVWKHSGNENDVTFRFGGTYLENRPSDVVIEGFWWTVLSCVVYSER
jgi:hypothetical protein